MKRKTNLKVKRKPGLAPTTSFTGDNTIQETESRRITEEDKRIFYTSLQKDSAARFTKLPPTKLLVNQSNPVLAPSVSAAIVKPCPSRGDSICSCDLPPPDIKWLTRRPSRPLDIDSSKILQEMRAARSKMIKESIMASIPQTTPLTDNASISLTNSSPTCSSLSPTVIQSYHSNDEDVVVLLDSPPPASVQHKAPSAPLSVVSESSVSHNFDDFDQEMEEFDKLCDEIDANILNKVDNSTKASLVCSICGTALKARSTLKDLEEHMNSCCPIDDIMEF